MVGIGRKHSSKTRPVPNLSHSPYGAGNLTVDKIYACDVSFDNMEAVDEKTRTDRRWAKHGDFTIKGMIDQVGPRYGHIDILIHSVAFSAEIKNKAVDTSRAGYLQALSISGVFAAPP